MSNISQQLPFRNILQPTLEFEYYCYAHKDTQFVTNITSFLLLHENTPWKKVHQNVCLMLLLKHTRRINILCFNALSSKSRTSPSLSLYSFVFSVYHYCYHDQHILLSEKSNFHENMSFDSISLNKLYRKALNIFNHKNYFFDKNNNNGITIVLWNLHTVQQ